MLTRNVRAFTFVKVEVPNVVKECASPGSFSLKGKAARPGPWAPAASPRGCKALTSPHSHPQRSQKCLPSFHMSPAQVRDMSSKMLYGLFCLQHAEEIHLYYKSSVFHD